MRVTTIAREWDIRPAPEAPSILDDPLLRRILEEAEQPTESYEYVARSLPRRSESADPPLLATIEVDRDHACVIAVRHPTGAIRFHAPLARLPAAAEAGPDLLRFQLPLDRSFTALRDGSGVRLWVLRIARRRGPIVIPRLARAWERRTWKKRSLHPGWVRVDPQRLASGEPLPALPDSELQHAFRAGRRTLMLLHGILSHTEAAFHGLARPKTGSSFFDRIGDRYDHIVAFNHFSISVRPEDNARAMMRSYPAGAAACDVIAHSRGGLLFRIASESSLNDPLVPRLLADRAILVASPNEGSPLADPQRLVDLVNLIANLAEIHPASNDALGIAFVAEALSWIAEAVPKSLPAVEDLAPGSELIERLQAAPPPKALCTVIASNYEPPAPIWKRLIDAGTDQVFGSANDLVVPTEASWKSGERASWIAADQIACYGRGGNLAPADGDDVPHTGFFDRPETLELISRVLSGEPLGLAPVDRDRDLPWMPGARGARTTASARSAGMPSTAGLVTSADLACGGEDAAAIGRGRPTPSGDAGIVLTHDRDHLLDIAAGRGVLELEPGKDVRGSDPFSLMLLADGPSHYQLVARYRNAFATVEFPTRGGAAGRRMSRIIDRHEAIRNFVRGKAGSRMLTSAELLEYGAMLFETLFPGDVRRLYDVARSVDRSRPLDLVFVSTLDWIADKPWEFAWDPQRRTHLATQDVNFTRNVFTAIPSDPISPSDVPLRILVVSAHPVGSGYLSIEEEESVILAGFRPLLDAGLASVEVLRSATPEMLHRSLEVARWDIVHFIGHGEYDEHSRSGYLVFEDDRGGIHRVPADVLRGLFCRHGVKLVFLNACESGRGGIADYNRGVAPALVAGGVPAVVANQYVVLDQSATAFARRFYWSLAHGASLGDAAREARVALNYQIDGEAIDWAVPVLFARDPSDRLCAPRPAAIERAKRRQVDESPRETVAIWDMNGVAGDPGELALTMTESQERYRFVAVDITAPIGTWRRMVDRGDGSRGVVLDASQIIRRISGKPLQFGVDRLVCITMLPVADGPSKPGDDRIVVLPVAEIISRYLAEGRSKEMAIADAVVERLGAGA
ncbi:MAG TPA: CHAT domain-containing protein [Thermoanaerobaculia bacterium]|nr:CHAT domain-containing protein [Thermoanaerobaculia bacterium]